MNWITESIAIGDWRDARNAELLKQQGITSILSLIGMFVGNSAQELGVQQLEIIPMQDGPGDDLPKLIRAVDALDRLAATHPPVLVHCRAGQSRSVAVVAAYLMHLKNLSGEEAIDMIAQKRHISLNREMMELVKQFGERR